jgi:putative Holliday junction resolvase
VRVLGIDYGERRVGVAVSDPLGNFARPLTVLERGRKLATTTREIAALCARHEVETVVVGLPLSMSGELGTKAREVRAFVIRLRLDVPVPVVEWDERLTTVAAERALLEGGLRGERRRQVVDQTAAALILQSWLEHRRMTLRREEGARDEE